MANLLFNSEPGCPVNRPNTKMSGERFIAAIRCALVLALSWAGVAAVHAATASAVGKANSTGGKVATGYGNLPLAFEPNQGQADPRVRFMSRGPGYSLFLTQDEAVLTLERQSAPPSPGQNLTAGTADTLRMRLAEANPGAAVSGAEPQPGVVSYFIGNDPKKWHAGIRTYGKVSYAQIYPGIDLVFYGSQRQLEYDFVVAPGADAGRIAWQIDGATAKIDAGGNLVLTAANGPATFKKPVIYQMDGGKRTSVAGRYDEAAGRIGFKLGSYDRSRPLVIDPVLSYAGYLGGSLLDNIGNTVNGDGNPLQALAVGSGGAAYVTGYTYSTNFPLKDPVQGAPPAKTDSRNAWAFVSKLSPNGAALEYSTYLGGSDNDLGYGIAVDGTGSAYVTGLTSSADFPVTGGAYQTICGGNWTVTNGVFTRTTSCPYYESAFVTKLSPDGTSLDYSTFLSGYQGSIGYAIAVDASGRAYVTGYTHEACAAPPSQPAFCPFPTTAGAIISGSATGGDSPDYVFVSVFNPSGSALLYSTLYGDLNGVGPNANQGNGATYSTAIAVDENDNFYVTGNTEAGDLPTTSGVLQPKSGPYVNGGRSLYSQRGYVAKFKALGAGGSSLAYATYFGGNLGYTYDNPTGIAVDATGSVYLSGMTSSSDFPITSGAFQTTCSGGGTGSCSAAFVSKLNPTASTVLWSSYLGHTPALDGNPIDNVGPVAIDKDGDAYVIGKSAGLYFFVNPVETSVNMGTAQAFVTEFDPTGGKLLFSTYVGGSTGTSYSSPAGLAVDGEGNIYVAGNIEGGGLIVTPGAFQTAYGGGVSDGFVVKIAPLGKATLKLSAAPSPATAGQAVTLTAVAAGPAGSSIPAGAVSFKSGLTVLGSGDLDATGTATYTTSSLKAGSYGLDASFGGDNTYPAVTSNGVKLTVGKAGTSTALAAAPNPAFIGEKITFTATVTPAAGGSTPAGSVAFLDGTTAIGTVALNSSGVAVLNTSSLAVGSHSITADYKGNASTVASSSSPVAVKVIAKVATSTKLAASSKTVAAGATVTFTATVKPAAGSVMPTGNVRFQDEGGTLGATTLTSGGTASFPISTLAAGAHTVSAIYLGDTGDAQSKSGAVTVTVTQ